ncbi:MAG: FkbM family methyltransferase [Verrucomicrobia bacterium]|nr:MAG: FkbM family methyltransferase [Verrucomicrobiota bacterium]
MHKKLIQAALRPLGYYLRSTKHFGDGYWQDLVTLMAKQHSGAKVMFDVGAHHGETLAAAKEKLPLATIHCFEPDPESFEILRSCAAGFQTVRLHPMALGAAPGRAEFHRNSESMTNSLLPTSTASLVGDYAELTLTKEVIVVPIETLDAICAREEIHWIDLLKTDCQGYDLMVLQGGRGMIASHRIGLITCEVIFDQEYDGQGRFHELLGFLDAHGYIFMGFYNMARNRQNECTFCDAIFSRPSQTADSKDAPFPKHESGAA